VDGIILAPSFDPERQALAYLTSHSVPVVLIDRMITSEFDQVGVENKRSTAQVVAHLIGHGHRRIGMKPGLEADVVNAPSFVREIEELIAGWIRRHAAFGNRRRTLAAGRWAPTR